MNNREEAKAKYYWGNKMLAKPDIPNVQKAISFYTKALLCLRSITEEEATQEDNKSIKDALEALLRGFNKLLCLSSEWALIVDELEKFLIFYVESISLLNKTHQRLPGLDALELKVNGPFTILTSKAPSASQKERLKNYVAVISLFHEEMATEKNHTLSSNDPVVKKSFGLYQQALIALEATGKIEPSVEEGPSAAVVAPSAFAAAPPASVAVSIPPKILQPAAQRSKQTLRAPSLPPEMHSVQKAKGYKFRVFDYSDSDDMKREQILVRVQRKEYPQALADFRRIMNCAADDYRCACNCQLIIGEDHTRNSQFVEAVTCYTEAFNYCKHIQKNDVIEDDSVNISKVLNAFVITINQITKNWAENFVISSKCMADFLNYYVDNFEALNSWNKKLSGLDGLNMDALMVFLDKTVDEVSREKTRIYLTVIGMFRKNTLLEEGGLESMIDEVIIKKDMWADDESMSDTFKLFDEAWALVQRIKGHHVLNPELKPAIESTQKRHKGQNESSSSSQLGFL